MDVLPQGQAFSLVERMSFLRGMRTLHRYKRTGQRRNSAWASFPNEFARTSRVAADGRGVEKVRYVRDSSVESWLTHRRPDRPP